MKIASIEQEHMTTPAVDQTGGETVVATKVIFDEVSSLCILSRLMIEALGRPGKDNDMELLNSGDRCVAVWTQPQLSLKATQDLLSSVIKSA